MLKEPTQRLDGPAVERGGLSPRARADQSLARVHWGLARRARADRLGDDRGRLRTLRPQQRQRARGAGSSACRPATTPPGRPGRGITSLWRARAGPTIPARARETAITGLVELFVETLR